MCRNRGFTLIELMVVVLIIGVLCALLMPAVASSREAARRSQCICNLKQLALAVANYESAHGVLPYGVGGGAPPGPGRVPRWSTHSQLLPQIEHMVVFNAINFSGVAWMADPVYGPPNQTALATKISTFLCPSDSDWSSDPYDLGHNNYRGNAGTFPYNLAADSPDGSGRNNGLFWFQSAVRIATITDGTSNTALCSERCLGSRSTPHVRADYYLSGPVAATCRNATPGVSVRYNVPHELSGQRWGDGALFYTRYNHVFTPNLPSCLLACTTDYGCQVVVSASSRHPGGVNLATADGAVRFLNDSQDPQIWKAIGTMAEGEVVSDSSY
jgi:prepilin-type N-terminal cleavage/methylation domain-containing protein/prepilin-type processing-associated H-X9-DG protein